MPRTGSRHSDEAKAAMRAAAARRWADPAQHAAASARAKANPCERQRRETNLASNQTSEARSAWWAQLTPARRELMRQRRSVAQKKRWERLSIDERKEKMRPAIMQGAAAAKARWAAMSPQEKSERLAPIWRASQSANPSSIEETVAKLLDALSVKYRRQAYIGRCLVDFWLKAQRLVIECDGDYWHSLPGRAEADERRDAWLKSRGFSVLRLRETDIRAGRVASRLAEIA